MEVNVAMWAFEEGKIRVVNIPDERIRENIPQTELLELVFYYGQNDFQPLPICSVSVGDVVLLNDKRFLCAFSGWKEMDTIDYLYYVRESQEKFALAMA